MNRETINPVKIHTPNSIKRFDSYIKPKEKVSIEKINIDNQINTEEINLDTTTSQNHSSSTLSDKSAIEINDLEKFTTTLYNAFNDDELYNYFIGIIKNRKIGDILDENDNLKPLRQIMTKSSKINSKSWTNEEYQQYLNESEMLKKLDNKIKDIRKNSNLVIYKGNDNNIKNLIIKDIVREDNGYDAVILQDQDGNYKVCSSFTDAKVGNDILADAYPLIIKSIPSPLIPLLQNIITRKATMPIDISKNVKQAYYDQTNSCYNLIEEYAKKAQDKGKNIELYGFSLGGGLTTTSYALLKNNNPELTDCISSVTVYNPYLLHTETYTDQKSKSPFNLKEKIATNKSSYNYLVTSLIDDEKLTIFSAEYDFVSTFNNITGVLNDRIIYVPAEKIDNKHKNITDIISKYIVGKESNHGTNKINKSAFDNYGNLQEFGEKININKFWASLLGISYNGTQESPDLTFIGKSISNVIFTEGYIQEIKDNLNFGNFDLSKLEIEKIITYISENMGNIDINELKSLFIQIFAEWMSSADGKENIKKFINDKFNIQLTTQEIELYIVPLIDSIAKMLNKVDNDSIIEVINMALIDQSKFLVSLENVLDEAILILTDNLTEKDIILLSNLFGQVIYNKIPEGFWHNFAPLIKGASSLAANDFLSYLKTNPELLKQLIMLAIDDNWSIGNAIVCSLNYYIKNENLYFYFWM